MSSIFLLVWYRLKSLDSKMKNIFFGILFISVSVGVFSFFMIQTKIISPKILICNEDESIESKLLMGIVMNDRMRSVAETEQVDFETGKRLLKKGEASAMLHVKENTIPALYEGELTTIYLYVNDAKNDFSNMVIDYFHALTEVINITQTTGLIYMDGLYSLGFDYSARMEKFNEMQEEYIKTMFLRDRIFHSRDNYGLFNFIHVGAYYYSFLMIMLFVFDYLIKENSLTSNRELRLRLGISGYREFAIESSDNIVTVLFTSVIGIVTDHLSLFLGGKSGPNISLKNTLFIIILAIGIRIVASLLHFVLGTGKIAGAASLLIYSLLFLGSGLILPSYYLGKLFIRLNQHNPLTMIHQILTVNRMM